MNGFLHNYNAIIFQEKEGKWERSGNRLGGKGEEEKADRCKHKLRV